MDLKKNKNWFNSLTKCI